MKVSDCGHLRQQPRVMWCQETAPGYPSADSAAFPVFNGGDAV